MSMIIWGLWLAPYLIFCAAFLSIFAVWKRREIAWFERLNGDAHVRHCLTCGQFLTTREEPVHGFCGPHWSAGTNIFRRGTDAVAEERAKAKGKRLKAKTKPKQKRNNMRAIKQLLDQLREEIAQRLTLVNSLEAYKTDGAGLGNTGAARSGRRR